MLSVYFLLCTGSVWALRPPDPNDKDFESVEEYRKRNDIGYNYKPKHVDQRFCHSLTEEECQEMDERSREKVKKTRQFLTPEGRRKLQAETLNVLVILIQWTDHDNQNRPLVPRDDLDGLFNSPDVDPELYRTGSVSRFIQRNSYGTFNMDFTVIDWVVTDNTEAFYSNPNRGTTEAIVPAFTPGLEAAENQGVDFSRFDQDNDGFLDLTVILHSGYDGFDGGEDCNTGAPETERIGSHARPGEPLNQDWTSSAYRLGPYVVASSYVGTCSFDIARLNIISHELFHPLGLPDLYDVAGTNALTGQVGGLGGFDIMVSRRDQQTSSIHNL